MTASRGDGTKRRTRWLIYAVAPVLFVTMLVNMPPFTPCAPNPPVSDHQYWFRATQVVVQPWRGPHHVYGVFTIPERYKFDHLYTAKLTIQGVPTEFQAGSPEDEDIRSGRPERGYYVKRVYLPTRTALWFLLSGGFGNLKTSCYWWLVIADRVR